MDTKKYPEVVDHLASLQRASPWELFFSDRLEQEYLFSLNPWYRDAILLSSMLAALLLMASHLLGWYLSMETAWQAQLLRCGAILSLLGTWFYMRRSRLRQWQHWLVAWNGLLVVATFLLLAQGANAPLKHLYYTNIFFVEIALFAFIRMPVNFASTTALLMLVMVSVSLYLDRMSLRSSAYLMFLLVGGTLLCMVIAFRMEKGARETFLQAQLIQLERDQLRGLNQQLSEQLAQDRVTRLFNRMRFEDELMLSRSSGTGIGNVSGAVPRQMLLAVQVDQFARFNELRGQDRGDDLLRDIARQIRLLQTEYPLVAARISGARFVLLFDAGDEPALRGCLEQLRVRLLGIASLQADDLMEQGVGLCWGGVHLTRDVERDPCDMIDRIFRHLLPLSERELTSEQYRVVTRFAAL
ncbi:MAG TPA: GGDEF domain-containing protein [Dongiaceae bacterium]|nr:GGDEF domain-containing protein [Dongiaceae bacterium]